MNRIFSAAGVLGGLFWITISLFPPDWGPPGTRAYAGYQLWNRLWTPALLLMALGFAGLFLALPPSRTRWARGGLVAALIGWALMMLGNFAEFWIFTTESYTGAGRNASWTTFLLGTLVMLLGSTVSGLALFRMSVIPKWLAVLLALMLPLVIGIGAINMGWLGWPSGGITAMISGYMMLQKHPQPPRPEVAP